LCSSKAALFLGSFFKMRRKTSAGEGTAGELLETAHVGRIGEVEVGAEGLGKDFLELGVVDQQVEEFVPEAAEEVVEEDEAADGDDVADEGHSEGGGNGPKEVEELGSDVGLVIVEEVESDAEVFHEGEVDVAVGGQVGHDPGPQFLLVLVEVGLEKIIFLEGGDGDALDETLAEHLHLGRKVPVVQAAVVGPNKLVKSFGKRKAALGALGDEAMEDEAFVEGDESEVGKREVEEDAGVEGRGEEGADLTGDGVDLTDTEAAEEDVLGTEEDVGRQEHVEDQVDVGAIRVLEHFLEEELIEELLEAEIEFGGGGGVYVEVVASQEFLVEEEGRGGLDDLRGSEVGGVADLRFHDPQLDYELAFLAVGLGAGETAQHLLSSQL